MDWTGLAAASWDYFKTDNSDLDFYLDLLTRAAGRALDVGCGTGRLLIPSLEAGVDIEGVDSSEEMLAVCRDSAAKRDLTPLLYEQRMQELDLPRSYSAIVVPGGSFQLVTDRNEASQTLRRFHSHLTPEGVVAISLDDPASELSDEWLGRWVSKGTAARTSDGAVLTHDRMVEAIDRADKTTRTLLRYTIELDGRKVAEEVHTMRMRVYDADEIRAMLEDAGLSDVRMHRGPLAVTAVNL